MTTRVVKSHILSTDLWSLQRTRLADSMADRLGEQFYNRCPEHLRPLGWNNASQEPAPTRDDNTNEKENRDDADNVSVSGESGTGEIKAEKEPKTKHKCKPAKPIQPKVYKSDKDINFKRLFFSALHSTLWWRWWLAGLFKLIGGKSSFYLWL